nr:hypothetical protein [Alkaliphilus serpentinus]
MKEIKNISNPSILVILLLLYPIDLYKPISYFLSNNDVDNEVYIALVVISVVVEILPQ